LNTGQSKSIEAAMPDLATLLGTRDGSTLHMRAGSAGRLYVWSNAVPFTIFDGNGASSRLLAGDTQKGACTVAESSHLTVACAYAGGEPGQAELRISTFSNDWPPVRGSYDVLPLSIEAPADFALSDDGNELASWGSRHHVSNATSKPGEGAFDSHVALVRMADKATIFDTHWQADRPIASSRFDPDGHGILVLESDGSAESNLRLVPRAGFLAIEHVAVPHATELAIAGPHRLWLVAPGSAAAIDEPAAQPVPPPN
jgi:hypothetical protein